MDKQAFLAGIELDKPMFEPAKRFTENNWLVYQWKKDAPSNDDARVFIEQQNPMEKKIWPKYVLRTLNLL